MGKAVLIILLASILTFGIISIQVNRSTSDAGSSSSNYYRDIYSRNIANSMIDVLRTKLTLDTSFRVIAYQRETVLGGKVSYRLIDTSLGGMTVVKATVIANYEGITKISEAYFSIERLDGSGLPPFMNYAVVSGNNLTLNGGVSITNAGNGLNANVHVNGNFSMNGNNSINGFLTYTGSAWSNPPNALNTQITPVQNPNNLPVHYQSPNLSIPDFNPEALRQKATEIYYGNKTFSGNIVLGTEQNPKIIYVSGDLIISGNVNGFGIFVSGGRTIINGNVSLTSPASNTSNVGLYSGSELIVNGNITLNAQIFANGRIILNGNNRVFGNLISRQSILMNGNVDVFYKPANEVLTKPVWSSGSSNLISVRTVSFYE